MTGISLLRHLTVNVSRHAALPFSRLCVGLASTIVWTTAYGYCRIRILIASSLAAFVMLKKQELRARLPAFGNYVQLRALADIDHDGDDVRIPWCQDRLPARTLVF